MHRWTPFNQLAAAAEVGCYWLPFSYLLETYTWSSCALSLYTEFITVCCVGVHSAEGGFGSYLTHYIKDNYTVDSMSSLPVQGRVSLMFQLNSPTDQVIRYHRGNREQQRRNMHLVYNVIWLKKLIQLQELLVDQTYFLTVMQSTLRTEC